jgi:hypothetical protein
LHPPSVSPTKGSPSKGSPSKTKTEISSARKNVDAGGEEDEGDAGGDKAKKNEKGLWNLFNAEYEI